MAWREEAFIPESPDVPDFIREHELSESVAAELENSRETLLRLTKEISVARGIQIHVRPRAAEIRDYCEETTEDELVKLLKIVHRGVKDKTRLGIKELWFAILIGGITIIWAVLTIFAPEFAIYAPGAGIFLALTEGLNEVRKRHLKIEKQLIDNKSYYDTMCIQIGQYQKMADEIREISMKKDRDRQIKRRIGQWANKYDVSLPL